MADLSPSTRSPDRTIDWFRAGPLTFIALHLGCFAVLWVGWSWTAVGTAMLMYLVRMFGITAFYHRYFSHRAFETSRVVQFLGALAGNAALQGGPLWWAAHHRHHHRHSDEPPDRHSPHQMSFFRSHMGWFLERRNQATDENAIKDFAKYPELRILTGWFWLFPAIVALFLYGLGRFLEFQAPRLETTGGQMFVWGFVVSTVVLYHVTYTINSLAHRFGSRRFETKDDSRNNLWLALLTGGEGWHNNHHRYPGSARQGFTWWEIDWSYYGLKLMAALGLIWNLRPAPPPETWNLRKN